jgi:hypothetical protein
MSNWVRTVLEPPSQAMAYAARTVFSLPSAARTVRLTPCASGAMCVISTPSSTTTLDRLATRSRSTRSTSGWVKTIEGVWPCG